MDEVGRGEGGCIINKIYTLQIFKISAYFHQRNMLRCILGG